MAATVPNNDPELIAFCNTQMRPLADHIGGLTIGAALAGAEFLDKKIAAKVDTTGDPTWFVQDGSPADGRTPITGTTLLAAVAVMQDLEAYANQPNRIDSTMTNAAVAMEIAVNPGQFE